MTTLTTPPEILSELEPPAVVSTTIEVPPSIETGLEVRTLRTELVPLTHETALQPPITIETQLTLGQGPAGPPGPPGGGGEGAGNIVVLKAGTAIGGHRVVRSQAGVLQYASKLDPFNMAQMVIGVTTHAAATGADQQVQTSGLMTEPGWTWTPDKVIFVGENGTLTQVAPTVGYMLVVGKAISATQINIGLQTPFILE